MKPTHYLIGLVLCSNAATGYEWDHLPIPASPGVGYMWELQNSSEEFNYIAAAASKPAEFTAKWADSYPNPWQGPGLTDWEPNMSSVDGDELLIVANRKSGTNEINAGIISSIGTVNYPVYIEGRIKMNKLVMASAFWLISADQTEEIDILEAYGSDQPENSWHRLRLHISHHVFIRDPLQDYQPTDSGTYYYDGTIWSDDYVRIGVYWRDPWHLEYYVNGLLVRTTSSESIIDPYAYTGHTGLSKEMHIVIDTEDQNWRSDEGITPSDEELADPALNTMRVDWIRVYKPVPTAITARAQLSGQTLSILLEDGRPDSYYDLLSTEDLSLPLESWNIVANSQAFASDGSALIDRSTSKSREFFTAYEGTPPYSALFKWGNFSGNWWDGYGLEQTDGEITLVANGRAASHDGGDGLGGIEGYALKANYSQDSTPGNFTIKVEGIAVPFRLYSIELSAEEGLQTGSAYLQGMRNNIEQWRIDPPNDTPRQVHTTATTGDLSLEIDEILWHGPTDTTGDPGGTLWGNTIDNLAVIVE